MVFKVLYYKKLHIIFYVSDFVSFYSFKNKSFIFQYYTGWYGNVWAHHIKQPLRCTNPKWFFILSFMSAIEM